MELAVTEVTVFAIVSFGSTILTSTLLDATEDDAASVKVYLIDIDTEAVEVCVVAALPLKNPTVVEVLVEKYNGNVAPTVLDSYCAKPVVTKAVVELWPVTLTSA